MFIWNNFLFNFVFVWKIKRQNKLHSSLYSSIIIFLIYAVCCRTSYKSDVLGTTLRMRSGRSPWLDALQ